MQPVVLVTGAGSGIGLAIATELSGRGCLIASFDLAQTGFDLSIKGDVSDAVSVALAVEEVERQLGPIVAVVSAAGYYETKPVEAISQEEWSRMLRVHLGGAFNLARAAAPQMIERGQGSIIAIVSELAIGGGAREVHYGAAKGAVIGLVRSLAVELAGTGVRVNGVAPGPTDTPMLAADSPWRHQDYLSKLPLGRLVLPHEVAIVVENLIFEATFTTGEIVSPNAGSVI